MELTPDQVKFHLAEFQALKAEVATAEASAGAHLRWAAIASALLFAWLATEGQDFDLPAVSYFAPAAVTLLLGGLSAVFYARVRLIGRYLREIEQALSRADLGWEKKFTKRKRTLAGIQAAAWVALLAVNLYAGLALQAELTGDQPYEMRQAAMTI